mmetsp:Transcript_59713/g.94228  ORF Transcript_59713/g.94228 Transcript_59713/m.94228 type:complete len:106 (+) Transcript_59713:1-318(+)
MDLRSKEIRPIRWLARMTVEKKDLYVWQWYDGKTWISFTDAQQLEMGRGYENRRDCHKFVLADSASLYDSHYSIHWKKFTVMDLRSKQICPIRWVHALTGEIGTR